MNSRSAESKSPLQLQLHDLKRTESQTGCTCMAWGVRRQRCALPSIWGTVYGHSHAHQHSKYQDQDSSLPSMVDAEWASAPARVVSRAIANRRVAGSNPPEGTGNFCDSAYIRRLWPLLRHL